MFTKKIIPIFLVFSFLFLVPFKITCLADTSIKAKIDYKTTLNDWIKLKLRQYPELIWLVDTVNSFEPNDANSLSLSLFGKHSPEFNEAISGLLSLHCFLLGTKSAYWRFTEGMPESVKISFKQFLTVNKKLKEFLNHNTFGSPDEILRTLETVVILKNLEKTKKTLFLFKDYISSSEEISHAKMLKIFSSFPDLSPSYRHLTKSSKNLVSRARRIVNYDSLLSLKEGPSIFNKLSYGKKADVDLMIFDLTVYLLDVCSIGAYSKDIHQNIIALNQSFKSLQEEKPEIVYAKFLNFKTLKLGLNPEDPIDQILTRCELRFKTNDSLPLIKKAFKELPQEELHSFVDYYFIRKDDSQTRNISSFMSMLKYFLMNPQIGGNDEQRLKNSVLISVSLLSKSLKLYYEMINKNLLPKNLSLNFEQAMKTIASLEDPMSWSENQMQISLHGEVKLII